MEKRKSCSSVPRQKKEKKEKEPRGKVRKNCEGSDVKE